MGQRIVVVPLQLTVSWHFSTSQEWWQSSAWSPSSPQWWADTIFVAASASVINNVGWNKLVKLASRNDDIKVFDQHICCNCGLRETSFITGAMVLHCNDEGLQLAWLILLWVLWCLCNCQRCGPATLCGKGLAIALYSIHGPIALVVRGSLSPCTMFVANSPLWWGAHSCT